VLDVMIELAQEGMTMVCVTHEMGFARTVGDTIVFMDRGEIVERGPSEDVTQRPAHPYTQLLVASAPDPDKLGDGLEPAPSGPPRRAGSALSSVVGCRFAPRCRLATDRCRAESPPLLRINSQRAAACWRLDVAAPDLLRQGIENREEAIKT